MPSFRDEDDITGTDVLRIAGMSTAIGWGVKKWWQRTDFNQVVEAHKIPSSYERAFQATQNVLADLGGVSVSRSNKFNQVGLDAVIRGVKEEKLFLTNMDITNAIERAAQRQDPSGTLVTQLQNRLATSLSPVETLEHIQLMSRESSSIYLHRTVSSFLADIGMMEERLASGKGIATTALKDIELVKPEHIELRALRGRGDLASIIEQIKKEVKGRVVLKHYARGDLPGEQLQLQIFGSPFMEPSKKGIPQLAVNIPMEVEPGIVYHGATQQSKYITGEFWLVDKLQEQWRIKKKMRYEEMAARRFLETYIHDIVQAQRTARRDIHNMEHMFHQDIIKPLEWVDDLPPGYHAGQDEYIRMRTQIARLSKVGGEELTDLEHADIIRRGIQEAPSFDPKTGQGTFASMRTVYPAASPVSMTRNIVSLTDWRQMGVVPEAFDWARRPMQAIRREYTPTNIAQRMIQENELTQMYPWATRRQGAPSPLLRTLYVKSELAPELAKLGMNIEGSALMTSGKIPLFAQEELARYTVSSQQLLDLKDILGEVEMGGTLRKHWEFEGKVISAGTVLGRDPEGLPVIVDEPFRLFQAARFQDKNKKDFVRLVGVRDLENMRWFKGFGDVKAMIAAVEQKRINEAYRLATGRDPDQAIHMVATMDELRKNRSLHYKQMFTSLHEFTRQNMLRRKGGQPMPSTLLGTPSTRMGAATPWPKIAQEFYANPEETINRMRGMALSGDRFSNEVMLREMAAISRAAELTPEQMSAVFGAVPEVFESAGENWKGIFTPAEITAITKGSPIGLAQVAFGGRYGPGSGGLGTIEPRMFELLSSPHLGELGPELQEEVIRRMTHRYGYRLGEQEILARSALSMLKPTGEAGVLPSLWTGEMTQAGGLLQVPGVGDIQVPSAQQMSQIAKYTTAGGVEVTPQLASEYQQLVEDARRLEIGEITRPAFMESMEKTRKEVMRAQMLTITGNDALLRGRLMGSRFLTAVPPTHALGLGLKPGEVAITRGMAARMATEVAEVYGDQTVGAQMMKELEAGRSVPGLAMRHPFTNPYSSAPVKVRLLSSGVFAEELGEGAVRRGTEPIAAFGEEYVRAGILSADTSKVVGKTLEDIPNIQKIMNLRLGPGVGMGLDFDADISSIMLLPSKFNESVSRAAMSDETEAFLIRQQLIKAKKGNLANITLQEAAADAALKLRIPKERLGLISESLQIARAAVLQNANKVESKRTMNALGFLGWLEQEVISSKHIPAGEAPRMKTLFANVEQSIRSRQQQKLMTNALSIVETGGIGEQFLREGANVAYERGGKLKFVAGEGIQLEQATQDITAAIGAFERQGVAGISPARMRQMVRGRGPKITQKEAAAIFGFGFEGESPFAGLIKTIDKPGAMASASRRVSSLRNKVASMGGRILEHAKPLALGFGAAVGIATLLSGPPRRMKMKAPETVRPAGTGGANRMPADMNPEEHRQQMGAPTVDQPMGGVNTSPVMPNSVRVSVRGRSAGGVDYGTLNSNISKTLGGAQVNSRVVDNRKSLDSQSLAKIIKEGY